MPFASIDEPDHSSGIVTLEDASGSRLAGLEKHVGGFGAKRRSATPRAFGHEVRVTTTDFERVMRHAERGDESLEKMIRMHAGHDLVHLRQIARIRRAVGA